MEATVFACVAVGAASVLLAADGAGTVRAPLSSRACLELTVASVACLGGAERLCVVDRPSNIVMVIIGAATLLPVTACLAAAWRDRGPRAEAVDAADAKQQLL